MNYLKNNKRFLIAYTFLFIIGITLIIFAYNDYAIYKEPIAKIISAEDKYEDSIYLQYGYKEDIYSQIITAKILNGNEKNKLVTIKNEYHKGQAYNQKYEKGDEIFISYNLEDKEITNVHIEGYKRDKYIVLITVSIILVIILVGKSKGLLSIASVLINIVLFNTIVYLNTKGLSIAIFSFIGSIIFSIICLILVSGFNKKTWAAITSSIGGLTITMLISLLVIHTTKYSGLKFEQMELLTRPYSGIFISEIIVGGLGAIMDISITISSSLNELIEKDKKISTKALMKSGIEIGKDVTGTMINVLFFTYICTAIPNLTILFRNGIPIGDLINNYINLELSRALTGAIGITVTIPISIIITLLFFKRRSK